MVGRTGRLITQVQRFTFRLRVQGIDLAMLVLFVAKEHENRQFRSERVPSACSSSNEDNCWNKDYVCRLNKQNKFANKVKLFGTERRDIFVGGINNERVNVGIKINQGQMSIKWDHALALANHTIQCLTSFFAFYQPNFGRGIVHTPSQYPRGTNY